MAGNLPAPAYIGEIIRRARARRRRSQSKIVA